MTHRQMINTAEEAAGRAVCAAHRQEMGLPPDGSGCLYGCGFAASQPVIDCPEGCAVADTCPLLRWDLSARAAVRALSDDDRQALCDLDLARADFDEGRLNGIAPELLADLERLNQSRAELARQPVPVLRAGGGTA